MRRLIDLLVGEYDGSINHYEQDATNSLTLTLQADSFNRIDAGFISVLVATDLNGVLGSLGSLYLSK